MNKRIHKKKVKESLELLSKVDIRYIDFSFYSVSLLVDINKSNLDIIHQSLSKLGMNTEESILRSYNSDSDIDILLLLSDIPTPRGYDIRIVHGTVGDTFELVHKSLIYK